MSTIRVNGRQFDVTLMGDKESNYYLTGARGAKYRTMRNVNTPDLMFLVSARGASRGTPMKGVWLSDKGGTLRQVGTF